MKNKVKRAPKNAVTIAITAVIITVILIGYFAYTAVQDVIEQEQEYEKEEKVEKQEHKENMNTLTYELSKRFKESKSTYSTYYDYYEDGNNCEIQIRVDFNTNKYKDGKNFLLENVYLHLNEETSELEEKSINNNTWYTVSASDDYQTKYYYTYVNEKRTYYIEYRIDIDNEDSFCSEEKDRFIESLIVKE